MDVNQVHVPELHLTGFCIFWYLDLIYIKFSVIYVANKPVLPERAKKVAARKILDMDQKTMACWALIKNK